MIVHNNFKYSGLAVDINTLAFDFSLFTLLFLLYYHILKKYGLFKIQLSLGKL